MSAIDPGRASVHATVVIPTKNPGPVFREVLAAAIAQRTGWPYEIVVVDSGSTDGTIEICSAEPRVRLLTVESHEFGHGRTRNFAIDRARGSFVAMLTHDARPANEHWLARIVAAVEADERIAGAFGRHLPYPNASAYVKRDLQRHFDNFLAWPAVMGIDDRGRYESDAGYRQLLHFFSDNNACLRRSVWCRFPYPDVEFAEDQLWAKIVLENGYLRAYADDAAVFHSHDYSVGETLRRAYDESRAFKRLFGYRLGGSIARAVARAATGTVSDLAFLARLGHQAGRASLALRTPGLQLARQFGFYLGQLDRPAVSDWLFRTVSLDDRLKRR